HKVGIPAELIGSLIISNGWDLRHASRWRERSSLFNRTPLELTGDPLSQKEIMEALAKQKLLVVHPSLQSPRGGITVVAWMLEALKKEYDITILTWTAVDFAALNHYYGTALGPADCKVYIVPRAIRRLIEWIPDPWQYQRYALLMRWCKIIKRRYHVMIAANNETDFGCKGIQYVHFPYFKEHWNREPKPGHGNSWPRRLEAWIKTRLRPWRMISGYSFKRMKQNLTLINSDWTARHFQEIYATAAITVYPPVPGNFPEVSWGKRESGFICIGRISQEKRLEEMIDILAAVKPHFPEVHLHIIGSRVGGYPEDYYTRVRKKVRENAAWVYLHEDVPRAQLVELVSRHRYGIHGMIDEHFGIAVAELVRGGCITFVPDSGGPVEIVGHDHRLLYHTQEEAVDRILHVMCDQHEQRALQKHLAARKELFMTEKFMRQIKEIVQTFTHDASA
ncbi:MAG: glycosyltransferase, partial [bacterium]